MSKIKVNVPLTGTIEIDTEDLQLGDDLVTVVRCRDCKFTDAHSLDMMHCKLFGLWMANNFFCADGTMALSSDKNKARK